MDICAHVGGFASVALTGGIGYLMREDEKAPSILDVRDHCPGAPAAMPVRTGRGLAVSLLRSSRSAPGFRSGGPQAHHKRPLACHCLLLLLFVGVPAVGVVSV